LIDHAVCSAIYVTSQYSAITSYYTYIRWEDDVWNVRTY